MSPRRAKAAAMAVPVIDTSDCTFDRDTHQYAIGDVVVPSVTQVLNDIGFVDFSMVPAATLALAQARGTYVHTVLHYYLENDFDLDDVEPQYRGYVDSALAFLDRAQLKGLTHPTTGAPIAVEHRFWDRDRRFAGTMDYVAWDQDGVLSITDWKTGIPSDVAAPLQTAAYEHGVRLTLFPDHRFPIRRRAVKLHRDGKPGTVETYGPETGHSYAQDIGTFLAALAWTTSPLRRDDLIEKVADMPFASAISRLEEYGFSRALAIAGLSCFNYRRNGMRHVA